MNVPKCNRQLRAIKQRAGKIAKGTVIPKLTLPRNIENRSATVNHLMGDATR